MEKLKELVRLLESSGLSEIEISEEGMSIRLKKPDLNAPTQIAYTPMAHVDNPQLSVTSAEAVDANEDELEDGLLTIDSPMVGTFYEAPAPGEQAFVKAGDSVEENQTVCIVEAMKLMNEVTAKFRARIEKILVENGEPVEYGQALFAVRQQ